MIITICGATFVTDVQELQRVRGLYRLEKAEKGMHFKDRDRWIIKILGAERGAWISGCCLIMWVVVHRYRKALKVNFTQQGENQSLHLQLSEERQKYSRLKAALPKASETPAKPPPLVEVTEKL